MCICIFIFLTLVCVFLSCLGPPSSILKLEDLDLAAVMSLQARGLTPRLPTTRPPQISNSLQPRLEYSCDLCDRSFRLKDSLRRHRKTHEPPKFGCQICGTMFVRGFDCKIHLKNVHGMSQCFHCWKTFPLSEAPTHVCQTLNLGPEGNVSSP